MAKNHDSGSEDGDKSTARKRISTTVTPATKRSLQDGDGPMGEQIDEAVALRDATTTYHFINTNARHLSDDGSQIYRHGVAATFGPEKFGKKLSDIEPGDVIISYVSDSHTSAQGGVAAVGLAAGYWSGSAVEEPEQVYPERDREYHLPVQWLAVLPEGERVTPDEKSPLIGAMPVETKVTVDDEEIRRNTRLLVELVFGRLSYPVLN